LPICSLTGNELGVYLGVLTVCCFRGKSSLGSYGSSKMMSCHERKNKSNEMWFEVLPIVFASEK